MYGMDESQTARGTVILYDFYVLLFAACAVCSAQCELPMCVSDDMHVYSVLLLTGLVIVEHFPHHLRMQSACHR
jgi:hypothetical protein